VKPFNLAAILEKHHGEKHLIVLHDYPDPDAIASAFAHRLISARFDIQADILYTGKISHNQNIALVTLLGIDLIPFREGMDLSSYQAAVLVDHQGTTSEGVMRALQTVGIPLLIVVDHHQVQDGLHSAFKDIQKTGATASLYARYLKQGLLELQKGDKQHVALATALLHGILTDTAGFIRGEAEDFQAAAYLSQFRDADLLEQIMLQPRSKQAMDTVQRALANRSVVENHSVAGIGYLRAEDRDAIPQAADFLLNEDNVHTAIVYGIVRGSSQAEALSGSVRTSKLTLDPDEFIKAVFGASADGHYYGGGRHLAGGFSIPIEFLAGEPCEEFAQLKWQVFDAQVKAKIFARIGVKADLLHDQHHVAPVKVI
jgi:nanoRNase/pAp phosphatase (c-di-AMP/oligoRNAs hydrolase)